MKKKGYLTRILVMCLIVMFSLADNPGLYPLIGNFGGGSVVAAATPAPSITPATTATPAPTPTTTPLKLKITSDYTPSRTAKTGNIPIGSTVDLGYNIEPVGGPVSSDNLGDLENVLIVVGSFVKGEESATLAESNKKSRFTRNVIKAMLNKILIAKQNNTKPDKKDCKVGFMKIGDSTVLEAFKTLKPDYFTNEVHWGNQLNSAYPNSDIHQPYMDKDIDFFNERKNDYLNDTTGDYSFKDNINVDLGNLFTKTRSIGNKNFDTTLNSIKTALADGKTKVYFILDGVSADSFYADKLLNALPNSDALPNFESNNVDGYQLNGKNKTVTRFGVNNATNSNVFAKQGARIVKTAAPNSFYFQTTLTASSTKLPTESQFNLKDKGCQIIFKSNTLNFNNIVPTCLYINKDVDNSKKYLLNVKYDHSMPDYDSDATFDTDYTPSGENMGFTPLVCWEDAAGIHFDDSILDRWVGLSNIRCTDVTLQQDIPAVPYGDLSNDGVTVVDTSNTWVRTSDGTSVVGLQNDVTSAVYEATYKAPTFYYDTASSVGYPLRQTLKVKCNKKGQYIFNYILTYNDPHGIGRTEYGQIIFNVKDDVIAYFSNKSPIFTKTGSKNNVKIEIDTLGQTVSNVKVILKVNNSATSKIVLDPLAYITGKGDPYGIATANSVKDTITIPITGVINTGTSVALNKKVTFQYIASISDNTIDYSKDDIQIESVSFTDSAAHDDTTDIKGAVLDTTMTGKKEGKKRITVYRKIKQR